MPIYGEDDHPLVVRASFVDVPSDEELEAYFLYAKRVLDAREGRRFVTILDASRGGTPPVAHLRMHASWLSMESVSLAAGLLGVVFISHKPMIRGALKALFWMQTSPVPCSVVSALDEAVEMAREWLAEAGTPLDAMPEFLDDPTLAGFPIQPADD